MRVGERGEEGARTGRGNGDGVEVARWIVCRPSEPIKAHNLERIRTSMVWHDRVVDTIALWYILSYVITNTPDYLHNPTT